MIKENILSALEIYDYEDAYNLLHSLGQNEHSEIIKDQYLCNNYKSLSDKHLPYGQAFNELMETICTENDLID